MNGARPDSAALAEWLKQSGLRLQAEEAALFLAAALVLLPPDLDLLATALSGAPPSLVQQNALRALWLRTGAAPPSPTEMPRQPLAPGLVGVFWRRFRGALSRALSPGRSNEAPCDEKRYG